MSNTSPPRSALGRVRYHSGDLALVATLTVALAAVLLAVPLPEPIRIAVALPVLLFAPGYALVTALMPATLHRAASDRDDGVLGLSEPADGVTPLERVTLAVAVSIAVVPMVTYAVNLAVPISLSPVLAGIVLVTVLASLVGIARRYGQGEAAPAPIGPTSAARRGPATPSQSGRWSGPNALPLLALGAALVLVVTSGAYALTTGSQDAANTEFYLVNETADGEYVAGGYPQSLTEGQAYEYGFGIENHATESQPYTVVAVLDGESTEATELERFSTTVGANETVFEAREITPTETGDDLTLAFLLYEGDAPDDPSRENAFRVLDLEIAVSDS